MHTVPKIWPAFPAQQRRHSFPFSHLMHAHMIPRIWAAFPAKQRRHSFLVFKYDTSAHDTGTQDLGRVSCKAMTTFMPVFTYSNQALYRRWASQISYKAEMTFISMSHIVNAKRCPGSGPSFLESSDDIHPRLQIGYIAHTIPRIWAA
jgi:hypothetical protein